MGIGFHSEFDKKKEKENLTKVDGGTVGRLRLSWLLDPFKLLVSQGVCRFLKQFSQAGLNYSANRGKIKTPGRYLLSMYPKLIFRLTDSLS